VTVVGGNTGPELVQSVNVSAGAVTVTVEPGPVNVMVWTGGVGWKTVQSETVLPGASEVTVTVMGGDCSVIVSGGKTGPAEVQLRNSTDVEVIVIVNGGGAGLVTVQLDTVTTGGPKGMVEPGTVTVAVETEPGAVETDVSVTVKALQVP
jgi:hypothetical protein